MTKKSVLKMFCAVALVLICASAFVSCTPKTNENGESEPAGISGTPRVAVTMENGGSFVIELYPEFAPKTVENFMKLVKEGFYDGLTFHRVIDGFMAQGGDPNGNGSGGSDEKIFGEFSRNGFVQNTLSHTRGVVSMARSPESFDSASSQFFICYTDECSSLDGQYAAFGKVVEGMDTVDAFLNYERAIGMDGNMSSPVEPIVIKDAKVVTDAD